VSRHARTTIKVAGVVREGIASSIKSSPRYNKAASSP